MTRHSWGGWELDIEKLTLHYTKGISLLGGDVQIDEINSTDDLWDVMRSNIRLLPPEAVGGRFHALNDIFGISRYGAANAFALRIDIRERLLRHGIVEGVEA